MIASGIIDSAAASGLLFAVPPANESIRVPSTTVLLTSGAARESPGAGENDKIDAATTPGSTSGQTTLRNVRPDLAPRSLDASRKESGTRSKAARIGKITYGSQM